jgi:hypothetical protein
MPKYDQSVANSAEIVLWFAEQFTEHKRKKDPPESIPPKDARSVA